MLRNTYSVSKTHVPNVCLYGKYSDSYVVVNMRSLQEGRLGFRIKRPFFLQLYVHRHSCASVC